MDVNLLSEEDEQKITNLGKEILRQGQNRLLVELRFLDLALGQFNNSTYTNLSIPSYLTNGEKFIFNPISVIKKYQMNKNYVARDFLHVIFHCVFRHMFISPNFDRKYWDLACDIAIENMITELGLDCLTVPMEEEQKRIVNKIKGHVKYVTAECIYDYLRSGVYDDATIDHFQDIFFVDNHDLWYVFVELPSNNPNTQKTVQKQKQQNKNGKEDGQSGNSDKSEENKDGDQNKGKEKESDGSSSPNGESNNGKSDSSDASGQENTNNNSSSNSEEGQENSQSSQAKAELEDHWKDISEKVQVDLETFHKERGDNSSSLIQNLKEVNREKYDYTQFLKKFAKMGEVMKINDDEFDYVYYTYGLTHYENMPLIEPLEYKDVKRIKDFVIAIDTSGSVEGDLVQTFLQKTYNILKSTESFFSKINLHIIQCDAEIKEDKKITNQQEFDYYIKHMELKGFGGTDFRPVFNYVDELIEQKEFDNLKGLIYFTDGCGTYPAVKPQYQSAFVFIDDNEYNDYDVPSWAVKLILQKKDI